MVQAWSQTKPNNWYVWTSKSEVCLLTSSFPGITGEGVGIQIIAPPTEGEANTALVRYIASVLGLKKNDVVLEKVRIILFWQLNYFNELWACYCSVYYFGLYSELVII